MKTLYIDCSMGAAGDMLAAALLSMLNSCSAGVSVVNIDNGFGAGFLASRINHMGHGHQNRGKSILE